MPFLRDGVVLFPRVHTLLQRALKPTNGCISWGCSNVLEWRMLYYYKTVIRPVTEYTSAVWRWSITAEQRDQLEAIQRRAVRIIFGKELDFETLAVIRDIPLLAERSDRQMRQLFTGMHDPSHCLHRLLLCIESAIHTLRNHNNYRVPFARKKQI